MKPGLLFVDDEPFFAARYAEELEATYEVTFVDDVDKAREYISQSPPPAVLILDMMMPAPTGAPAAETEDGLATGLWVLREAQKRLVDLKIPVLLLTNRGRESIADRVSALGFPPGQISIRSKLETPAFALPALIKRLIEPKAGTDR